MLGHDPAVVTVKVPFAVRKRGGRKLVLTPDGAPVPTIATQGRQDTRHGHRARVSVAEDAGDRPVCDHQGDRECREDQPIVCQPGTEVDVVRAGHGRGDPEWAGKCYADTRGGDGAVPIVWSRQLNTPIRRATRRSRTATDNSATNKSAQSWHSKLAASSELPWPLYAACCG